MREIAVIFDPERKLFLYFGVLAVAVVVGPFGTYEAMSFWQRVMFWSLDILGCLIIVVPVLHVFYNTRLMHWLAPLPRFLGGILLGAIPGAGYITLLYNSIGTDLLISTPYPLLIVQVWFFSTLLLLTEFVLWPLVFGPDRGTGPAVASLPETIPAPAPAPVPVPAPAPAPARLRLAERLPAGLRSGQIISISMQDHYAQITTTSGEHLLLIRLSDAIELLDGLPGAQIHRSHWVATEFSRSLTRAGRRHELKLSDGRTLPVSAARLADVRMMLEARAGT